MNVQLAVVMVLFVAALCYMGRLVYHSLFAKKGCGSNCKCGVDFSDIDNLKPRK